MRTDDMNRPLQWSNKFRSLGKKAACQNKTKLKKRLSNSILFLFIFTRDAARQIREMAFKGEKVG